MVVLRARFPLDFFAALSRSGQALAPLVKARGFGMTPPYVVRDGNASAGIAPARPGEGTASKPALSE